MHFHTLKLTANLQNPDQNLSVWPQELDDYAPEPEVHKYLHSRLMHFDVPTLYELHYNSITLGKVWPHATAKRCLPKIRRHCAASAS